MTISATFVWKVTTRKFFCNFFKLCFQHSTLSCECVNQVITVLMHLFIDVHYSFLQCGQVMLHVRHSLLIHVKKYYKTNVLSCQTGAVFAILLLQRFSRSEPETILRSFVTTTSHCSKENAKMNIMLDFRRHSIVNSTTNTGISLKLQSFPRSFSLGVNLAWFTFLHCFSHHLKMDLINSYDAIHT